MRICLLLVFALICTFFFAQDPAQIANLEKKFTTEKSDTGKINILAEMARLSLSADPQLSAAKSLHAYKLSSAIKWKKGLLKSIIRLAWALQRMNKADSSLVILQEGLKIAEETKDVESLAHIRSRMASAYARKNNYPATLQQLHLLKKISQKEGLGKIYSSAMTQTGRVFEEGLDFQKALSHHLIALQVADSLGLADHKVTALSNIATVYTKLGNRAKAKEYYFECVAMGRTKQPTSIAPVLANLGNLYYYEKEYDSALYYLNSSLQLLKKSGDKAGIGYGLNNIAGIYLETGNTPKAIQGYLEALSINRETGNNTGVANVNGNLAECYIKTGEFEKALRCALASHALSKDINEPSATLHSYQLLAQIYSAKKDFETATHYMALESAMKDSLAANENQKQMAEMLVKFDTEKREAALKKLSDQNKIQALSISNSRYLLLSLGSLLVLVLVAGALIFRQNKLRSKQRSIELEQKLLRSQMNPHFIFNSLQAIQNFIFTHDKKEAAKYLSAFAHVIRAVLENSRLEQIPLEKEISLLEKYLQLQKLRFGERFDYELHIDPELDLENTLIPPMLSQPFIENAVEHGMGKIETGGKIDIYFRQESKYLLLEIIDNGNGMQQEETVVKEHHSLAMIITKERIALLNKKKEQKTIFTLADAFPERTERRGVKVSFQLAMN
jgi:tetratricopeptide (TPR) repeat protein